MAQAVRLTWGAVSITGNFRENNEDRCHVDHGARFFLVADGMGGQCAGEKASELAVELISQRLDQLIDFDRDAPDAVVARVEKVIGEVNTEIMALGELDPNYHNMGTTITFLLAVAGKLFIGGLGDSRTSRLRDGQLEQLTKDHSLTQALIDAGTITQEEAVHHRYRNVLWKYLGTKEGNNSLEARVLDPQSGDRFVLCSDGVTDGVRDEIVKGILADVQDPQQAAERIVQAAQNGGSRDNITCVVVHVT